MWCRPSAPRPPATKGQICCRSDQARANLPDEGRANSVGGRRPESFADRSHTDARGERELLVLCGCSWSAAAKECGVQRGNVQERCGRRTIRARRRRHGWRQACGLSMGRGLEHWPRPEERRQRLPPSLDPAHTGWPRLPNRRVESELMWWVEQRACGGWRGGRTWRRLPDLVLCV